MALTLSDITRYALFVLNLFNAIAGIVLIMIGATGAALYGNLNKVLTNNHLMSVSMAIIIIGAIVFITSFFGCFGAIKQHPGLLTSYATIFLCFVAAQIIIAVVVSKKSEVVPSHLEREFRHYWDHHHNDNSTTTNAFQADLQCCGKDGANDYNGTIPDSCCPKKLHPCTAEKAFKTGCARLVHDSIKSSEKSFVKNSISFAILEFFGSMAAFYVAHTLRTSEYEELY